MAEGRRERRRVEMRERLLSSALALFASQGFEATTIDQIAENADVARQTVLNHYPTKREFVAAWGERRRAALDSDVVPHTKDLRTQLHRLYAKLADINEKERDLTRTINHVEHLLQTEHPVPPVLVRALEQARRDDLIVAEPGAHVLAEILTAVYFDTLSRWLAPEYPPFDLSGELLTRVDVVLDGLTTGVGRETPAMSSELDE